MSTPAPPSSPPPVPFVAPPSPRAAMPVPPALEPSTSRWRALRSVDFRLYLSGQIVSAPGTWLQGTAQSWLVLELTGSPAALALVTVCQFTPQMLFLLVAGVVADRFPKRRIILVSTTLQMLQAFLLAALVFTHTVQVWHVYVLALMLGLANTLGSPARQSFVGQLADRHDLQNAVALNSSVMNTARVLGPSIGGIIIAAWGTGWCFLLNGISYIAALTTLFLIRTERLRPERRPARGAMLTQILDGLRHARGKPPLLFSLCLLAFIGTFGINFGVILPLIAKFVLNLGAEAFGTLNSALGVGSLVAAFGIATRLQPNRRLVLMAATCFSLLLITEAFVPWYVVSLLVLAGLGGAQVLYTSMTNTLLQLGSDEEYRGRVLSLYQWLFMGTTPIGGALTGIMAETWGVQTAIAIEGSVCLLACIGAFVLLRRSLAAPGSATPAAVKV
jgi:MFS family permease